MIMEPIYLNLANKTAVISETELAILQARASINHNNLRVNSAPRSPKQMYRAHGGDNAQCILSGFRSQATHCGIMQEASFFEF